MHEERSCPIDIYEASIVLVYEGGSCAWLYAYPAMSSAPSKPPSQELSCEMQERSWDRYRYFIFLPGKSQTEVKSCLPLTQFVLSSRLNVSGNPPLQTKNQFYHLNEEILRAKIMPHRFKWYFSLRGEHRKYLKTSIKKDYWKKNLKICQPASITWSPINTTRAWPSARYPNIFFYARWKWF